MLKDKFSIQKSTQAYSCFLVQMFLRLLLVRAEPCPRCIRQQPTMQIVRYDSSTSDLCIPTSHRLLEPDQLANCGTREQKRPCSQGKVRRRTRRPMFWKEEGLIWGGWRRSVHKGIKRDFLSSPHWQRRSKVSPCLHSDKRWIGREDGIQTTVLTGGSLHTF